uniref:Small ribosomal subunit protein bS18c n=1 Tax=Asterarcys sp. GP-2019 TaxID=2650791 RepID=A0A5J6XH87_9CHLO|nr:ribosomal protein S18 [Asterarcys sp. GP-2019]
MIFSLINSNSSFSLSKHTNNTQNQNLETTNGLSLISSNLKQEIQKKQNIIGNGKTTSHGTSSNIVKSSISNSARRKVLSVSQILARVHQKKQRKLEQKKRKKPFKPIIPPKSFILLFKDKPEKYIYNRRIIDYKHCGLLQRYIGLGGKILPRRQTKLTAKQQRYVAKTIKSARIMGLLPFVTKERSFFR